VSNYITIQWPTITPYKEILVASPSAAASRRSEEEQRSVTWEVDGRPCRMLHFNQAYCQPVPLIQYVCSQNHSQCLHAASLWLCVAGNRTKGEMLPLQTYEIECSGEQPLLEDCHQATPSWVVRLILAGENRSRRTWKLRDLRRWKPLPGNNRWRYSRLRRFSACCSEL
jgi:DNA-binding transcriptional LysR family regulator